MADGVSASPPVTVALELYAVLRKVDEADRVTVVAGEQFIGGHRVQASFEGLRPFRFPSVAINTDNDHPPAQVSKVINRTASSSSSASEDPNASRCAHERSGVAAPRHPRIPCPIKHGQIVACRRAVWELRLQKRLPLRLGLLPLHGEPFRRLDLERRRQLHGV